MSDATSPFGGSGPTAVAEPEAPESVPTSSRRGPVLIALVAAVAVALGAAAYFLLFSGGGDDTGAGAVPVVPHASSSAQAPSASATASAVPVAVVNTGTGRDPFKPLVSPLASSSAAAAGSAAATPGATAGGGGVPAGVTQVVTLKGIDATTKTASVTVNNKPYAAVVGQPFATYFSMVGIFSGSVCGSFLYGDASFQLCKGQTVSLQR